MYLPQDKIKLLRWRRNTQGQEIARSDLNKYSYAALDVRIYTNMQSIDPQKKLYFKAGLTITSFLISTIIAVSSLFSTKLNGKS